MDGKTFELLEKMYSEFLSFKDEMIEFKSDMTKFKDDTTSRLIRIEANQESIKKDIDAIIGIQPDYIEQNEKQHKEMMDTINWKIEVMEAAIRHISGQTTMNTVELTTLKKKLA